MDRRRRRLAAGAVASALAMCAGLAPVAVRADERPVEGGAVVVRAADAGAFAQRAAQIVAAMSTRERAASVVMGHIPTTDAASLSSYMTQTGIGGFILMGANIPGDEASLRAITTALTPDPALPPLIAVDQEGGDVARLGWDPFPSALALKNEPAAAAQDAFAGRGALLLRAGIGVNFGIVADVAPDASSFIYRRALGTTPQASAERVTAAVAGEASASLSTLKHFPGHGAAPGDSHTLIPATGMPKAEWEAADGMPFRAGIDAGAELLMFGHLAFTAVDAAPASLSAEWHRIAREELGFDGVTITDDLGMLEASGVAEYRDPVANAVAALAAGNDMVLAVMFSTADTAMRVVDGIVAAVESGALPAERLEDAATRVTELRLELAAAGRGMVPCGDCEAVAG
ncbi:glycoside hydrolase family 3 N-terminal domain-containing protein [Microbacterium sp.]|uniref:glycoside hydrolase family 3 N-terminal domain-containing protein n=1 Tax=Microbacterium sp. TaxID=51671 RepID=UPI002C247F4B|nr:glycoside hydrolase family 3 N-terminal domain-containing protein [Microbacterium sp.]HWL79206.1 glycoside hydrolase family 3 N-terminal domain-containing protein [Microbacterium sp.]